MAVMLLDEPEYTEGEGGAVSARVRCRIERHRDRLIDATVRIVPPKGLPWIGRVARAQGGRGVYDLTCTGAQADLARVLMGPLLYCDTRTSEWNERTAYSRAGSTMQAQVQGPYLAIGMAGGTYPANAYNGLSRRVPATSGESVTFEWYRPTQYLELTLHTATAAPGISSTGVEYETASLNLVWSRAGDGAGGTSGAVSATLAPAAGYDTFDMLLLQARFTTERTLPGSSVRFSDMKVYGVDGVSSPTAPTVIRDVCDRLPAWVLPEGDEYREYIDATDTTAIEPFVVDHTASALDVISDIAAFRDRDFSFSPRLIGGRYVPVPVYEARDTTPSYVCHADDLDGPIAGGGIETLADAVRVSFSDADGRTRYIDVIDDSEDNYLSTIGRSQHSRLGVPTASATTAELMGQRYLQSRRRQRVIGTPTLSKPIHDMAGAEVLPCQIERGRWIRVHGTQEGTIDARISETTKTGAMRVRMSLDDTPTGLDAALAMLTVRRTIG